MLPDGTVVVGRRFDSKLDMISPQGHLSEVSLPKDTVLPGGGQSDLATLSNGEIAAVLYGPGKPVGSWRLGLDAPGAGGWREASPCAAVSGVSSANGRLVAFGSRCVEVSASIGAGSSMPVFEAEALGGIGSVGSAVAAAPSSSDAFVTHGSGSFGVVSATSSTVAHNSPSAHFDMNVVNAVSTGVWFLDAGSAPYIGYVKFPVS